MCCNKPIYSKGMCHTCYFREYRKKPHVKEARKAAYKEYYTKNKESCVKRTSDWAKKNKERVRELQRNWYKDNPELAKAKQNRRYEKLKDYYKAYANSRRGRCKQATPKWVDRKALVEIYKNRPEGYHVDHIIPLNGQNVCGLHVPANLQYLPAAENIRKKNKI